MVKLTTGQQLQFNHTFSLLTNKLAYSCQSKIVNAFYATRYQIVLKNRKKVYSLFTDTSIKDIKLVITKNKLVKT